MHESLGTGCVGRVDRSSKKVHEFSQYILKIQTIYKNSPEVVLVVEEAGRGAVETGWHSSLFSLASIVYIGAKKGL